MLLWLLDSTETSSQAFALAGPGCGQLNQAVPLTQGEHGAFLLCLLGQAHLDSTLLCIGEGASKAPHFHLGLQLYLVRKRWGLSLTPGGASPHPDLVSGRTGLSSWPSMDRRDKA